MTTPVPTTSIDALWVERAWLRRLATALVSDSATAEDLVQETWVTALRSPPRGAAAARGWLRRVLQSRLYDHGRSRQRRQAREQVSLDLQVAVETPEELTARMELHRRLAVHMASMDERLREVLFLRFVEELEPIEVARRLDIPDGTVRWRLKRGLDELRGRLDADAGGDRRRWLPLLAPLAAEGQPVAHRGGRQGKRPNQVPRGGFWSARLAWVATIAALLAVVSLVIHSRRGATVGNLGSLLSAADRVSQPPGLQDIDLPANPPAVAASDEPPCPEAQALEKERNALAIATDPVRVRFKDLFFESPANPALGAKLAAVVEPLLFGPGTCGHSLECRGVVCRVGYAVPSSSYHAELAALEECYASSREILQARSMGIDLEYVGKTFDSLANTSFSRFDVYLRLVSPSGDSVPPEQRQMPKLPSGWDRDRGAVPATLRGTCRARVVRVREELAALQRRITKILPLWSVFQQSSANPDLEREVAGLLRPVLSPDGKAAPVEIECRARVCALRPSPSVPEAAMRWALGPDAKTGCSASADGDWWYARLFRQQDRLGFVERYAWPWKYKGDEIPTMLSIRPPAERRGVTGPKLVFKLARDLGFARMVAACEKQSPAKGALTILVRVPETCGPSADSDGRRITVEYGGELGSSPLASCLRLATDQVTAQLDLPGCSYGWVQEWRLDFPHPKIDLPDSAD
jgi:RNA polymerase sigma factor (sigma-70 family)